MNLNILVILPLIFAFLLLFAKTKEQIRMIALLGAGVQLILAFYLYYCYRNVSTIPANGMYFESIASWFPSLNINYHIGVDGISIAMILLTAFVVLAGILVSWNVNKSPKEFFFLITLLSAGAYGFFISLDLFCMFFFLEVAVIPKYLLIGIWGSGKKEYSANKLALMLMGGSALVLVGILGLYYYSSGPIGGFNLMELSTQYIPLNKQLIYFPFLFVGFGVFTAIFPFHTWVPDGHSSAPTAASMFLAGVSMKLGGYGCLRVATFLLPEAAHFYSPYIIVLSTIAILYGAFATMMQKDLKYMNAYSSISHCGFVLLGIGMLTPTAINGAVLQMISHGLMTALFFAAIGMIYERAHTRIISELGGLLKVMPFIGTIFILAGLCSLGLPGLSGFVAEMTVFIGSWARPEKLYRLATILSTMSIVVTAVYILRASGTVLMGEIKNNSFKDLTDAHWYEKTAGVLLLAGILLIGLSPFVVNELIAPGAEHIMNNIHRITAGL